MTDLDSLAPNVASVLLCAPSLAAGADDACTDLLGGAASPNVLWIACGSRPEQLIDRWRRTTDAEPANAAVIVVSESGSAPASDDLPFAPRVSAVSNPGDLTGLGIEITEVLREWADEPGPTRVCFDSLTTLLQYVDLETAYEFLHVVAGRAYAVDARVHFHLDAAAHDDQTVASLATLFDAVAELDGDGVDLRSRS